MTSSAVTPQPSPPSEPSTREPSAAALRLREAIGSKQATVAIIGLGYVGLPLVRTALKAGFRTIGFDIDPRKIEQLRAGQCYLAHVGSDWLECHLADGRFEPTAEPHRLAAADAILICVPTPLTPARNPDLSYVVSTVQLIAEQLRPGQLICLESTTYPTTTRDVLLPRLQRTSLSCGKDYFLAYSPEREDPGNPTWSTHSIPKVVGGVDPVSSELAVALYRTLIKEVVAVSNAEVAEACKILENTYRAVNIALVNELKVLCQRMGIDVWEVIEAAKTKPFGFQAFYPGPGLGGHCIPIDPFYLSWIARKYGLNTRFIELAGEVNTAMPDYVLQRISAALNDQSKPIRGSRIAILGIAYKANIGDTRESPAFSLMVRLAERGATLSYSDPHVAELPRSRSHDLPAMQSQPLTAEYLRQQDCVVITTAHQAYDYTFITNHAPLVVDTRNATAGITRGNVVKA